MHISGEDLKTYRKSKKLTQQELAEMLGTQRTRISEWERGKYEISPAYQRQILSLINSRLR